MPVEIVHSLTPENVEAVTTHLKERYLDGGLLTPDFSNYAKGRLRCWIEAEWRLRERDFVAGHADPKLWSWIKTVWPKAEIGLVTYGPVGINPHRDDSYADYTAVAINLGEVEGWGYRMQRADYGPGPAVFNEEIIMHPKVGDVMVFNSKDQHWVINPAEDRWAINLWMVKSSYKAGFEAARTLTYEEVK